MCNMTRSSIAIGESFPLRHGAPSIRFGPGSDQRAWRFRFAASMTGDAFVMGTVILDGG